MNELKMGDTIEVRFTEFSDTWAERVYIKSGLNGGAICVARDEKENYFRGDDFKTNLFHSGLWRRLEEKKYRPFTWEEKHQIAGFWVRHKKSMNETMITELYFMNYVKIQDEKISFTELLENYIFLDGSPCGVEE